MPLEDLSRLDIIMKPDARGKIGLCIIDAGVTTDPDARMELLLQKLKGYARMVLNGGFNAEYPDKKVSDFFIKVVCMNPPTEAMRGITFVGKNENQMRVVFEIFNPAQGDPKPSPLVEKETSAATEEELAAFMAENNRIVNEFKVDEMFLACLAMMMELGVQTAKVCNFIFGRPYMADGKPGEPVPTFEGDPKDQEVDVAALSRARNAGRTLGAEYPYWFVVYSSMRMPDDSDDLRPCIIVEGWKRGMDRGLSMFQDFTRAKFLRPFKLDGQPEFGGLVAEDIFKEPDQSGAVKSAENVKPETAVAQPELSEAEWVQQLAGNIPAQAEHFRSLAKEHFGLDMNYDAESIPKLDHMRCAGPPADSPDQLKDLVFCFGSYLGETIRHLHGGSWCYNEEHFLHFELTNGVKVFPFAEVRKCFTAPEGASLEQFYASVLLKIAEGRT